MYHFSSPNAQLDCYDALTQSASHSSLPAIENPHRELLGQPLLVNPITTSSGLDSPSSTPAVTEVIPLLASSSSISLDQPILRTSGQTTVLKTSHVCQWLEVAASYHTSVIVQSLMQGKGGQQTLCD